MLAVDNISLWYGDMAWIAALKLFFLLLTPDYERLEVYGSRLQQLDLDFLDEILSTATSLPSTKPPSSFPHLYQGFTGGNIPLPSGESTLGCPP